MKSVLGEESVGLSPQSQSDSSVLVRHGAQGTWKRGGERREEERKAHTYMHVHIVDNPISVTFRTHSIDVGISVS